MESQCVMKMIISHLISIPEPEITVGHWPFPTNIAISGEQNLIARTNLMYISYGEAIIMFLLLINGRPISNPYFKLCTHSDTPWLPYVVATTEKCKLTFPSRKLQNLHHLVYHQYSIDTLSISA